MRWLALWAAACAPVTRGDDAKVHADADADVDPDAGTDHPATRPGPPNVLLVVLDDVGVDRMASWRVFGADPSLYPQTPVLDGLAADGVTFDHAYAMPLCSPTRATVLTGRYPWRHGVGAALEPTDPVGLPYDEETLAERLATASDRWTTSWLGKWHLTVSADPIDPVSAPEHHGFDDFAGTFGNLYQKFAFDGQPQNYEDWEHIVDGATTRTTRYATTVTTDDAIDRIGADGALPEPWFVGVAFNSAHDPWHFPPAAQWSGALVGDEPVPQKFAAMIESADHELGRILDAMDPDVLARTVVIVVGDNGSPRDTAMFGEDPNRMKSSPYELGVRVPLIVAGAVVPDGVAGATSHRLVSAADLFPTVADLAGVARPADAIALDGRSLLPLVADPDGEPIHPTVYAEKFDEDGHHRMIRDARFKLVQHSEGPDELYDLGDDVTEGTDLLATSRRDEPAEMGSDARSAYEALLAALPTPL